MRAVIKKSGDITLVGLEGQMTFETILPFRKQCIEKLWGQKVIFNFYDLSFVGSSGITSFFETIKDFIDNNGIPPKFIGVKIEFQKLFEAWFSDSIEIYDYEEFAVRAFSNPDGRQLARKLNSQNLGLPNKYEPKDSEWVPTDVEPADDPETKL